MACKARCCDRIPSSVVEQVLEGIDDQMLRVLLSLGEKGLSYRQRRAAIRQSDLDHHPRVVRDEHVSQRIAVFLRKRHELEVTVGPHEFRADFVQSASRIPHGHKRFSVGLHHESLPEQAELR